MWRRPIIFLFLIIHVLLCNVPSLFAQPAVDFSDFSKWQTNKSEHFVVYYYDQDHAPFSLNVLNKAEEYYDKIAYQIGYSRYSDFWTWEDRVKIFIFPDQMSFLSTTGQQIWSKGYAVRDSKLFESRAIVTFKQENGFTENLLPHEISHLIVKDLIGFDRTLPVWFEEGVAQQLETVDPEQEKAVIYLAKNGQMIPSDIFHALDIRREKDEIRAAVFYAQSRSIVEYLIRVYGQESFQRLCGDLKEVKDFDQALKSAYPAIFVSFDSLYRKWLNYLQDK